MRFLQGKRKSRQKDSNSAEYQELPKGEYKAAFAAAKEQANKEWQERREKVEKGISRQIEKGKSGTSNDTQASLFRYEQSV